jgi:hypothetical protein
MRKPAAAAIALFLASPASAQLLWQNVRSGMSLEEVRAAQPTAAPPPRPARLNSGARCALQIPQYEVARQSFKVCFFMLHGRLVQVMLSAERPSESLFHDMAGLLRARYGAGRQGDAEPCRMVDPLRVCEMEWLLETGANASIIYMDVRGDVPILNINYQTRIRDETQRI